MTSTAVVSIGAPSAQVQHPAATAPRGRSLQLAGGIAALLEGLAYIVGTVLILGVLPSLGLTESYYTEPAKLVPFVAAHYDLFVLGSLIFTISAVILLPIVLALHDRLNMLSPGSMTTATILGVMGFAMVLLNSLVQYGEWRAIASMSPTVAEHAFAGGWIANDATEHAGAVCQGLWILLLSWCVIGRGGLPKWLGYFGVLVGAAQLLALFGPPFGILLVIVWYVAVGITLVRAPLVVQPGAELPPSRAVAG